MHIIQHFASPNHDDREGQPVDMLIMHYTDMRTCEGAVERLCDPAAKVSAHYVVSEAGDVFQLVPEDMRAWHAGESHWRGHSNMNARSVGIEICNPGHNEGYTPFPKAQMEAVVELSLGILGRHTIPPRNVQGHSDIAFMRKMDPGELFDWPMLARAGVGIFPEHARPLTSSELKRGDSGVQVQRLQQGLVNWGYGLKLDGVYGEKTEKCVIAFQRHFRPMNLNGIWDHECAGLLAALHGMV